MPKNKKTFISLPKLKTIYNEKTKLYLCFALSLSVISCKKLSSPENEIISTITVHNPQGNESPAGQRLAPCGKCPGTVTYGHYIADAYPKGYCSSLSAGICSIVIANITITPTISNDGFIARFENQNGRLAMIVNKLSLDNNLRKKFFDGDKFRFDYSAFMDADFSASLKLTVPYLIKANVYNITAENALEFTVLL